MFKYRLYGLKDGRLLGTSTFEAADDVAAIEAARACSPQVESELWCDSRLIAFIPAMIQGDS